MKEEAPPVRGTARLTIEINDVKYVIIPLPKRWGCRSYRLKKTDGTEYTVSETNVGTSCTCPDFASRERKGGCKHCKALRAVYLLD